MSFVVGAPILYSTLGGYYLSDRVSLDIAIVGFIKLAYRIRTERVTNEEVFHGEFRNDGGRDNTRQGIHR